MNTDKINHGRVIRNRRIQKPSEEALLSVVLLGLIASVSDGKADYIEIQTLRDNISRLYVKDSKELVSFINIALKLMNNSDPLKLIDSSCHKLKEEFSQSQLVEIFDYIADILKADGKIEPQEEVYLGRVAEKFELTDILRTILPTLEQGRNLKNVD
jgi:uncharacterized tellurite resistance protein B-like protein